MHESIENSSQITAGNKGPDKNIVEKHAILSGDETSGIYESHEAKESVEIAAITEASPDHPTRNEDHFFHSTKRGIVFVGDGMGGVPAGEYASTLAAAQLMKDKLLAESSEESSETKERIRSVFLAESDAVLEQTEVEKAFSDLFVRMNREIEATASTSTLIRQKAIAKFHEEYSRAPNEGDVNDLRRLKKMLMTVGTTGSLIKTWKTSEGKGMVTVGNMGDSRVYRLRKGKLEKLSEDSSPLNLLIRLEVKDKNGQPLHDQDVDQEFSKATLLELADSHPELQPLAMQHLRSPSEFIRVGDIRNAVTQALGLAALNQETIKTAFKPFVSSFELEDDDVLVVVTDGISDNLDDTQIEYGLSVSLQKDPSLARAAERIQKTATLTSLKGKEFFPRAKKDDATAVLMRYKKPKGVIKTKIPTSLAA